MRLLIPLALLLASCGAQPKFKPPVERAAQELAAPPPVLDLAQLFDCLRENRLALVSAHRGQANPTRAENAMSSFRESAAAGPLLLEIDIARSADGTLVLLHDNRLDRTTTGTGPVTEMPAAAIVQQRLKDPAGRTLDEQVPTLAEVLAWAHQERVLLQLDLKRGVPRAEVVDAVRKAGVEDQVVLIAYDMAGTKEFLALAPDMMVSASGANAAEWTELLQMAAGNRRLLGFTGTNEPDPARIKAMDAVGMEAIVGTLGRAGQRLDDRYMADGDGSEYAELAANGAALIASDRPVDAWNALRAAGRDGTRCLAGGK